MPRRPDQRRITAFTETKTVWHTKSLALGGAPGRAARRGILVAWTPAMCWSLRMPANET